jgi:hypothetical protein
VTESGVFPAQPVEKSRESGATRERERTSLFRWLRDRGLLIYMTAALSAAAPFKHERMEAAEIPPGANWMEGIETLHKGVLSDKVETQGTFYINNQTHREKWIFGKEGDHRQVEYATKDIEKAVDVELSETPTHSVTICSLHTHLLSIGESQGRISEEQSRNVREGKHSVSFPPSGFDFGGDIGLPNIESWGAAFEEFRGKGGTVEVRQGVVDAAGITYHRPINEQDLKQEFPEYFAELEQRKTIVREWEKATSALLRTLNDETLDVFHRQTKDSGKYDTELFATSDAYAKRVWKRLDLEKVLRGGEDGWKDIARVLFAGNPKAQKLQEELITLVVDKAVRDQVVLDETRLDWIKTSMTVAPEQLPSTKEYTELREAYARNATYIRFVPHKKVSDEPSCAGTDYKP